MKADLWLLSFYILSHLVHFDDTKQDFLGRDLAVGNEHLIHRPYVFGCSHGVDGSQPLGPFLAHILVK